MQSIIKEVKKGGIETLKWWYDRYKNNGREEDKVYYKVYE